MICFYNTLSGRLENFEPLNEGEVRMYTCGPTVYDYAHIGNFRAFVFEDLLRRFLEFKGYKVQHVMNLTDVDDKTIAGARRENLPLEKYTAPYVQAFNEDLRTLNCLMPAVQPRATDPEEMKAMQDLIARLLDKKTAYVSEGSVYYRVAQFPGYGKLSKKKLELNIAGASERMDSDEYEAKEQVTDFVLWKKAKEGEPSWDSPWGKGRPGWHIECSAMSIRHLGETFDLHAGGEDLVFPHHENEIAQSEGATGKPFVKYWLHCRFLLVNGEKMSKSKGNFYTLRDLLAKGYDPMAIRCALLSTHYRMPLNFTLEGLEDAKEALRRFDDCYWQCVSRSVFLKDYHGAVIESILKTQLDEMKEALSDDLNISVCLAHLSSAVKEINTRLAENRLGPESLKSVLEFFETMDRLLGLDISREKRIPEDVIDLMKKRTEVREQIKETGDKSLWKKSDELRDHIQTKGWLVKDGKPGEPSAVKKKRRAWDL